MSCSHDCPNSGVGVLAGSWLYPTPGYCCSAGEESKYESSSNRGGLVSFSVALKFLKFLLIIIESGCGPLGLLAMAVARAYGAKKIIAFDIEQSRVDFAVKYNADIGVVCPFNTDKVEPLTFATDFMNKIIAEHGLGSGVDLTIEATGAEACVQMAVVLTKSGGTCEFSIMKSGVNHDLTFLSYTSWTGKVADFGSAFPLHGKGADYERYGVSIPGNDCC